MISSIIHYFYPDLSKDEIKRFGLLSAIFTLIIGTYWILRLLKNTIFLKVAFPECLGWAPEQGCLFQPIAKSLSPFVVLIMVLVYSKLVDLVKKHQLFYILCSAYALLFAFFAGVMFLNESYGATYLGKTPLAIMGWISYFTIESFGSLIVALFWSFTNSITDSDAAKRGFPFIIAVAQISAIAGSATLFFSESIGAFWPLLTLASVLVAAVIPLVHYFMIHIPASQLVGNAAAAATEKKREGFIEGFISGLTLLFSRSYLLGVLVISTIYETVGQIIEYQMFRYASISPMYQSPLAYAQFQSIYGMSINLLSFLIALLGTSYLIKRFGLRISLLVYPIIFGFTLVGLIAYFFTNPSTTSLLWVTFAVMVISRAISYAFNNPTKEMMYIPTSKDAKFKSKGWIDTFGSRFAKAGGARITNPFKHNLGELMLYGSTIGLGLIGIWLLAALFVGYKNKKLLDEGEIIQ